jgi:BolA protein
MAMRPEAHEVHARLAAALPGARIEVIDESHLHAGHAGARGGAGHFRVRVIDEAFTGLRTVARHRLVYDAVRDWMPHRVHALAIEARSPAEATRPSEDSTL